MDDEKIKSAILTLEVLIDCCKEDGTTYNAIKEWEALEVFKQLQQERDKYKSIVEDAIKYIEEHTDLLPFNEDGEGGGLCLCDYEVANTLEILRNTNKIKELEEGNSNE